MKESIEGCRASFTVKADLCGNDGEEKKRGGCKRGKNEQEGSCDGAQDGHRKRAKRIFIYFTRNVIKVTVVMLAVTMATEDRGAAVHSENQQ